MRVNLEHGKYTDDTLLQRYKEFCKEFLIIGKEPFNGQSFKPLEWQEKWFLDVLCTFNEDGSLAHTLSTTWISKKMGKTTFLASVLLFLSGVRERDQLIVLAQSKEMAKKNIFGCIQEFIDESDDLKRIFWDRDSEDYILNKITKTKILLESGKNTQKSGYNSSFICWDEIAEAQQFYADKIWGRLRYAGAARAKTRQIVTISTANYDRATLGYSLYCEAKLKLAAIADKKVDPSPHLHALIYEVPEGQEHNPEAWWPQLPSVPAIVPKSFYIDEYNASKDKPLDYCNFRCLLLNQWISTPEQWHSPSVWEACTTTRHESEFYGKEAVISCDFASHNDLCSWCVTVKDGDEYYVFPRFLMAKATAEERTNKDGFNYIALSNNPKNNLYFCQGERTSGKELVNHILADAKKFKAKMFCYDPYGMEIIRQELEGKFPNVKEVPQKGKLAYAMWQHIDDLILKGKLKHPDNEVLNFCYKNCKPVREDDKLVIIKASSHARIDGIDAAAMGCLGWLDMPANTKPEGAKYIFMV